MQKEDVIEQEPEILDNPTTQYQLRKGDEVIGEWSTPADSEFQWPKHGKESERWVKKNKRWQRET